MAALAATACAPSLNGARRANSDPAETARQDALAMDQALAHDEARAQDNAAAVLASARSTATSVVDALPRPDWSFFPGLEAERQRDSLTRVRSDRPRPVLFVVLDTTRADHLSAFGYHRKTSPHLEALASEGVRFSRFYTNGAWTRPSITTFFTSKHRHEHGVEIDQPKILASQPTVTESFREAGYATVGIVGNQTVRASYGFDKGFETYIDIYDELSHNPHASVLADRAIQWIDGNDNPDWFMWLMVVDAHDPYTPEAAYDKWEKDYPIREMDTPAAEYRSMPSERTVKVMQALYDAELLQMDTALGSVFEHLRKTGQWDDLTVVVLADHGEAFGENNCFRHPYHFWEPNVHVPLIIKSPALVGGEGKVEDRLFAGVDIAPTLLDLADVPARDDLQPSGTSIAEVLAGPITEGWDRTVYTEMDAYGLRRFMVRQGDLKYLRFLPTDVNRLAWYWHSSWEHLTTAIAPGRTELLFNLADDPTEQHNLMDEAPELAASMAEALNRFNPDADHDGNPPTRPFTPPPTSTPEDAHPDHDDAPAPKATPTTTTSAGGAAHELDDDAMDDLRSLGYVE